jgi:hypothetical protein
MGKRGEMACVVGPKKEVVIVGGHALLWGVKFRENSTGLRREI